MKRPQIEAELAQIIEECRLVSGGQLPPERELCERLEVSRGTLRKALDVLEAKGLIRRHVGRGTFAAKALSTASSRLIDIADTTSPWELMELRLMLEPQIARLAAMRASQSEINFMQHCVDRSGSAADQETYEIWDSTLHRAIAEAAHNQLVLAVFEAVNELRKLTVWGELRAIIVSPSEMTQHWCGQHRAFVEAISRREPQGAEMAARLHVEDVFRRMREGVATLPPKDSVSGSPRTVDQKILPAKKAQVRTASKRALAKRS